MLEISLLFKKLQTSRANNSRILRIKKANFQVIVFIWTQTYGENFNSALVYLLLQY